MLAEFTLLSIDISVEAICALPEGYAPAARDNSSRTIELNQLQTRETLDPNSTPQPGQVLSKTLTFGPSGEIEIDLTDAPIIGAVDGDGEPADGETLLGARPFFVFLCTCRDDEDNAGVVTVKEGASNGYPLWGVGNEFDVPPNSRLSFYVKTDSLPLVSGTDKILLFQGAEDDQIEVLIVFKNAAP